MFDPRSVGVRFMVDKLALGQVFLRVLQFPPIYIIPPMLHTCLHVHTTFTRRTMGEAWEPSKGNVLLEIREH
jgi:hypothetical protein